MLVLILGYCISSVSYGFRVNLVWKKALVHLLPSYYPVPGVAFS